LIALGMILGFARDVSAQTRTAQERARDRAATLSRLDELKPEFDEAREHWRAIRAAQQRFDEMRRDSGLDTLQVGPLRVLVIEGGADRARPFRAGVGLL
jgi:hypothetical protein